MIKELYAITEISSIYRVEMIKDSVEKVVYDDSYVSVMESVRLPAEELVPIEGELGRVIEMLPIQEKEFYDEIGLHLRDVNGKPVLVRDDIDPLRRDALGRTNLERMERGLAPIDENGESYHLHHVNQKNDGVLAELTEREHYDNYDLLHRGDGEVIDRPGFDKIRAEHWKERVIQLREGLDYAS